jgi:membrane protein implicated in regulation of membrane protease activity
MEKIGILVFILAWGLFRYTVLYGKSYFVGQFWLLIATWPSVLGCTMGIILWLEGNKGPGTLFAIAAIVVNVLWYKWYRQKRPKNSPRAQYGGSKRRSP